MVESGRTGGPLSQRAYRVSRQDARLAIMHARLPARASRRRVPALTHDPSPLFQPPEVVGPFRVRRVLASGTLGPRLLVEDDRGRLQVLKLITDVADDAARIGGTAGRGAPGRAAARRVVAGDRDRHQRRRRLPGVAGPERPERRRPPARRTPDPRGHAAVAAHADRRPPGRARRGCMAWCPPSAGRPRHRGRWRAHGRRDCSGARAPEAAGAGARAVHGARAGLRRRVGRARRSVLAGDARAGRAFGPSPDRGHHPGIRSLDAGRDADRGCAPARRLRPGPAPRSGPAVSVARGVVRGPGGAGTRSRVGGVVAVCARGRDPRLAGCRRGPGSGNQGPATRRSRRRGAVAVPRGGRHDREPRRRDREPGRRTRSRRAAQPEAEQEWLVADVPDETTAVEPEAEPFTMQFVPAPAVMHDAPAQRRPGPSGGSTAATVRRSRASPGASWDTAGEDTPEPAAVADRRRDAGAGRACVRHLEQPAGSRGARRERRGAAEAPAAAGSPRPRCRRRRAPARRQRQRRPRRPRRRASSRRHPCSGTRWRLRPVRRAQRRHRPSLAPSRFPCRLPLRRRAAC